MSGDAKPGTGISQPDEKSEMFSGFPKIESSGQISLEDDGRWIAEISELPGVMAYGPTREAAIAAVHVLALRVMADRLEHGEPVIGHTPAQSVSRAPRTR